MMQGFLLLSSQALVLISVHPDPIQIQSQTYNAVGHPTYQLMEITLKNPGLDKFTLST